MAEFSIQTTDPLAKRVYEEKLIREAKVEEFFAPMTGGSDSIVWEKNALEKGQGDRIMFGFSNRLQGDGRTDDEALEGFEEKMIHNSDEIVLRMYRHAVRDKGAMHRKRAAFNVTMEQKDLLKQWTSERIEKLKFAEALKPFTAVTTIDASTGFAPVANEATAKSGLATGDKITPQGLSALRRYAANGGTFDGSAKRVFEPIAPVKYKGKSYFVLLTSHEVTFDMQYDSTFINATQHAKERGDDNPLFKIADFIWDGVIVVGHERVPSFNDGGGSTIRGARSVLLGAGSICWAWGERVSMHEDTFDYGDEFGVAMKFIAGCKLPVKDGKNFRSVGLITSCSKLA